MCKNVQTTLGINLRPGPILPRTLHNILIEPQVKMKTNFLLLTSQKIIIIMDFFLMIYLSSTMQKHLLIFVTNRNHYVNIYKFLKKRVLKKNQKKNGFKKTV